ncbi:hypothetical protein GCM10027271_14700 [Saccharopolyspora gloriosae]|uniref:Uncharacterized protein n=1 Tax=Saccharopolyspora gloriosae TaxID=455344 RepID=A0A840N9F0_9PSEU|nr:hypothetical protein [Saccharopolyspora gloriosae]MBB5067023.1 hypothetical protein [Saccharopolyspora gloriosae]
MDIGVVVDLAAGTVAPLSSVVALLVAASATFAARWTPKNPAESRDDVGLVEIDVDDPRQAEEFVKGYLQRHPVNRGSAK